MFKKTLLATTALVLGASVAFAMHVSAPNGKIHPKHMIGNAGHSVHGISVVTSLGNTHHGVAHNNKSHWTPGATYSNYSKDANAEFISWFGFNAVNSGFCSFYSSNDHFCFSEVGYNAVGFSGAGKKVKGMNFAGFGGSTASFEGAILSSVGGLPGGDVAVTATTGFSDTAICCTADRHVSFPGKGVTLSSGTPYFAAVRCANSPCFGGWNMEDTDLTGATVDYWHVSEVETYNFGSGTHTFSFSSPWHPSTFYPEAGAVIVK